MEIEKNDLLNKEQLDLIDLLSRVKKHITIAPTHTPRDFYEMVEFYDDSTNQRMYFYVNGSWKYVSLT